MTRIAYLGPPGTNGEEAAIRRNPAGEHLPCASHRAVATAVESGEADEGVVAIENSINGSVAETLDILIHETELQIQAEIVVPIEHVLVVKPGTRPDDVRVVFSHPQALGQCRQYLETNFPNATREAALSTAESVELAVRRGGDAAAIATRRAAELHGGEIIATGIADVADNVTRFAVLGHGTPPRTGRDRTSIAFTFIQDKPGALVSALKEFADRNINCSKMESRPTREVFGEYVFLVDFWGHVQDAEVQDALAAVRPLCSVLKVFGSYPRWK